MASRLMWLLWAALLQHQLYEGYSWPWSDELDGCKRDFRACKEKEAVCNTAKGKATSEVLDLQEARKGLNEKLRHTTDTLEKTRQDLVQTKGRETVCTNEKHRVTGELAKLQGEKEGLAEQLRNTRATLEATKVEVVQGKGRETACTNENLRVAAELAKLKEEKKDLAQKLRQTRDTLEARTLELNHTKATLAAERLLKDKLVKDHNRELARQHQECQGMLEEAEKACARKLSENITTERDAWAEDNNHLLKVGKVWVQYQAVLDLHRIDPATNEYLIYNSTADWDKLRSSLLTCLYGGFNAGKSHFVSLLTNRSFPAGNDMPTMGLSLACAPRVGTEAVEDCFLDTAGSNTPIGEDGKEQPEKIAEDLLRDMCLQTSDVSILVAGEIDQHDQDTLKALVNDRTHENILKRGVTVLVVHNYASADHENTLLTLLQRFALAAFPDMELIWRTEAKVPSHGVTYLTSPGTTSRLTVKHFFLGSTNSYSRIVQEHNFATINAIRGTLEDAKRKTPQWSFSERSVGSLQDLVPKYIDYRNLGPPEWSSRPVATCDLEGHIPDLCRNNSVCERGYGEMDPSWILGVRFPPGSRHHLKLARPTTRSTLLPVGLSNATAQQHRHCSKVGFIGQECNVTMVLPGCHPLYVMPLTLNLGANITCIIPEPDYVNTDDVPALLPGTIGFDVQSIELPGSVQTRLCSTTWKAGVLTLHFVPEEIFNARRSRGGCKDRPENLAEDSVCPWRTIAITFAEARVAVGCFAVIVLVLATLAILCWSCRRRPAAVEHLPARDEDATAAVREPDEGARPQPPPRQTLEARKRDTSPVAGRPFNDERGATQGERRNPPDVPSPTDEPQGSHESPQHVGVPDAVHDEPAATEGEPASTSSPRRE